MPKLRGRWKPVALALLVLLLLLAGGQLLGLTGVLLAMPVAALAVGLYYRFAVRPRHPLDAEGRPVEQASAPDGCPESVDESMRQEDS